MDASYRSTNRKFVVTLNSDAKGCNKPVIVRSNIGQAFDIVKSSAITPTPMRHARTSALPSSELSEWDHSNLLKAPRPGGKHVYQDFQRSK
jgi:hypothetical protein